MTSFTLEGWAEKLAPPDPADSTRLLYHQARTRAALHDHEIVLNTYNTGTGKTRAAHQRLIDLDGSGVNVLIVAPTNELIGQHVRDAEDFVRQNGLNYRVLPVRSIDLEALQTGLRNGETLQRLLRNPREFDPEAGTLSQTIVVTNPDIFYLGLYMRYSPHDRRNVFAAMLGFDYIIIDEFHYYSSKQAAVFLFALTMFDAFGYFSHRNRRICLLSATPRSEIIQALGRLFGERMAIIAPDNEPDESEVFETKPALAPLEVHVETVRLEDWVTTHADQIKQWISEDRLDGAIISGSLARINTVYAVLRPLGDAVQRLTGPEPTEARSRAAQSSLILATPTVDLGYNFVKHNKPERQNLDFVVCEAQYRDELVQRIGRVGRVLGKDRSDIPSQAVVLLPDEAARGLKALDGQRLSRADFARHLETIEALPIKHRLDSYLTRYALEEAAYPLAQFGQMLTENDKSILNETFERFKSVIAPHSRCDFNFFEKQYRTHGYRKGWLSTLKTDAASPPPRTADMIAEWWQWQSGGSSPSQESLNEQDVTRIWQRRRDEIIDYIKGRVKLTDALFSFRDSFEGPSIAFYDPQRWFSSEGIGVYSAIHLLAHYDLRLLESRAEFQRHYGEAPEADFYAVLEAQRRPPAKLRFQCETLLEREAFHARYTGQPAVLEGLSLISDTGGVPLKINQWLKSQQWVCLIIPPDGNLEARVRGRLRHSPLWPRDLTLSCENEDSLKPHEGYLIFLGTSAFEAHAALLPVLRAHARSSDDPIIC